MAQINDPVLGEIGLDLVRSEQIVGADLLPAVLPVVHVAPYRRRLLNFRDDFIPDGGAGGIQFLLTCPETESWLVINGSVVNAGADDLLVSSFVRPGGGGAGQKLYVPLNRRITAFQTGIIIGAGVPIRTSTSQEQFIPDTVEVPTGAELSLTLTSLSAPFDVAVRVVALQVLRLPITRDWSAAEFTSVTGPAP